MTTLATLPTVAPAGSVLVRVQLSATEMTADQVDVYAHDPDGVWEDVLVQIQPTLTLGSDAKVLLSSDPQPALTLAVGAITAAQLALDACQKIADILARRHTSAIEASGNGETLDVNSLYGALAHDDRPQARHDDARGRADGVPEQRHDGAGAGAARHRRGRGADCGGGGLSACRSVRPSPSLASCNAMA